jgi:hypothetical protein
MSDVGAAEVASRASQRAAIIGLTGAMLGAVLFAIDLPGSAAERHVTVVQLLTGNTSTMVQASMLAFIDVFRLLGVIFLVMIPLVFVMRRPQGHSPVVTAVD